MSVCDCLPCSLPATACHAAADRHQSCDGQRKQSVGTNPTSAWTSTMSRVSLSHTGSDQKPLLMLSWRPQFFDELPFMLRHECVWHLVSKSLNGIPLFAGLDATIQVCWPAITPSCMSYTAARCAHGLA